jgi:hypothetical protein
MHFGNVISKKHGLNATSYLNVIYLLPLVGFWFIDHIYTLGIYSGNDVKTQQGLSPSDEQRNKK